MVSWAQLVMETKQVGSDILPDLWFIRLITEPKYIGFDIFLDPWFLKLYSQLNSSILCLTFFQTLFDWVITLLWVWTLLKYKKKLSKKNDSLVAPGLYAFEAKRLEKLFERHRSCWSHLP